MSHLAIRLFHGREHPEEQLDDWGVDGPVLGPIQSLHITYNNFFRVQLPYKNSTEPLPFHDHGELLYYNGVYYGDWEIASYENFKKQGFEIEEVQEEFLYPENE